MHLYAAGCRDVVLGRILKKMFETDYFRCVVVPDADTVEICGALKVVQYFSVDTYCTCTLLLLFLSPFKSGTDLLSLLIVFLFTSWHVHFLTAFC